ncbi:hypothetical protein KY343_00825 [Candidatus Woesearchaeota archaeon]|nr:hypothetical protein [Candidatus Woesearchaeota archaeon]
MKDIDKIFNDSDDLGLIFRYYKKHGQPEKAVPHIKRIFDQMAGQDDWNELMDGFRKYRSYLTEKEQRDYINGFVRKTFNTHFYDDAKKEVLRDFSDMIDDDIFSLFFSKTIYYNVLYTIYPNLDAEEVYGFIEKNKHRIEKKHLTPRLPSVLANFIVHNNSGKKDIDRFEPYLDDRARTSLIVRAIERAHSFYRISPSRKKDSPSPEEVFSEFRDYISRDFVYSELEKNINKTLKGRISGSEISMSSKKRVIELLRKDYLTDEQTKSLVSRIASVQFGYCKPGYHQKDPAGDIHESPDPEYGLPYAFETVRKFPDAVEQGLAKRITRKYLSNHFFQEAVERRSRKKRASKEIIEACRLDRDTVELALADAVRGRRGLFSLGFAKKILDKFKEYINREYVAEALAEKLHEYPEHMIKEFGDYLSDEHIKSAFKSSARKRALEDNFGDISRLVESSRSRFTKEELSDFFLELFEDVKENIQVSKFKGKNRKKQDAVFEFFKKFAEYIPRRESTEDYFELFDD